MWGFPHYKGLLVTPGMNKLASLEATLVRNYELLTY